jgi:hypothetical protein
MTLALAIVAQDGIVVAADGRAFTTDETGFSATQEKVNKIRELEPGCALLVAGRAELVLGEVPAVVDENLPGVYPPCNCQLALPGRKGVIAWANYLSNSARAHYHQLLKQSSPASLRPTLAAIIAGYVTNCGSQANSTRFPGNCPNSTSGEGTRPLLVTFSSASNFVVSPSQEPYVTIGMMGLAHYLLRRFYHPGLSVEQALGLAYYCLHEACFHNPLLGGRLTLAIIRPDQPLEWVAPDELFHLEQAAERFLNLQQEVVQHELIRRNYRHQTHSEEEGRRCA